MKLDTGMKLQILLFSKTVLIVSNRNFRSNVLTHSADDVLRLRAWIEEIHSAPFVSLLIQPPSSHLGVVIH
jgi:hypothetical protein